MLFAILLLSFLQNSCFEAIELNYNYQFADSNSVIYDNNDKLILLTHNVDSLEQVKSKVKYPNPFGPSGHEFDAIFPLKDSSFVEVFIKDSDGIQIRSYLWHFVEPGVYQFHWADDLSKIPSGWFYIVVQTKSDTTIDKAVIVK